MVDLLFDGASSQQPVHRHLLLLAYSPRALPGLQQRQHSEGELCCDAKIENDNDTYSYDDQDYQGSQVAKMK